MNPLRIVGVVISAISSVSCASHSGAEPREMKTCVEGAMPAAIDAVAFSAALRQAQQYSDKVYGEDCFVCAEVIDEPATYFLHITSPIDDTFMNTSAGITVRKSDGKVIERSVWHSCYARIRRATQMTPNTSLERTRGR